MKVVVYGATGQAGRPIVEELVSRGHTVVGVARKPEALPEGIERVADDLSDEARIVQVITGADAVVSAYNPPRDDTDQLIPVTERLIAAVAKAGTPRLIVVGGCGSLEYSPGVTVLDSGHWPAAAVPIATSHHKTLDVLRESGINWTYFSPPMLIVPGERTGKFRLGGEELIKDATGKSTVSFEDYAVALVDELERPAHERARFTIGY